MKYAFVKRKNDGERQIDTLVGEKEMEGGRGKGERGREKERDRERESPPSATAMVKPW